MKARLRAEAVATPAAAVQRVPDDRMSDPGQMHAHLMGSVPVESRSHTSESAPDLESDTARRTNDVSAGSPWVDCGG